ncbi:MAG: hypothetical protein WCY15_01110 [Phenylobacterium sp.]|jgi:hypothetical protein|uniref:hypothetical protein n=1 Tax=Phenylobacterium sp. TaxID=1871053 RepID=UPI002A361E54|nr:hypothetical protein [Phenylobacterium sp.]MDX9997261.1 hypothetical protein [Phenylobacterium sp.]
MSENIPRNQRVRAISLDDPAQVRRWAAIFGAPPSERPSRRLARLLALRAGRVG